MLGRFYGYDRSFTTLEFFLMMFYQLKKKRIFWGKKKNHRYSENAVKKKSKHVWKLFFFFLFPLDFLDCIFIFIFYFFQIFPILSFSVLKKFANKIEPKNPSEKVFFSGENSLLDTLFYLLFHPFAFSSFRIKKRFFRSFFPEKIYFFFLF